VRPIPEAAGEQPANPPIWPVGPSLDGRAPSTEEHRRTGGTRAARLATLCLGYQSRSVRRDRGVPRAGAQPACRTTWRCWWPGSRRWPRVPWPWDWVDHLPDLGAAEGFQLLTEW